MCPFSPPFVFPAAARSPRAHSARSHSDVFPLWQSQCTGELLQAYYVNLARSHSTGAFRIADPEPQAHAFETDAGVDSPTDADADADGDGDINAIVDADGDVDVEDAIVVADDESVTAGSLPTPSPSTPEAEASSEILIPDDSTDGTTVMDTVSTSSEVGGAKDGEGGKEAEGGSGGEGVGVGIGGGGGDVSISEDDITASPETIASPTRGSKRRGGLFVEIVENLRPRRRRIETDPT